MKIQFLSLANRKDLTWPYIRFLNTQTLKTRPNQIGERIRYLQQMEAQEKMNSFYYGDLVTFTSKDGAVIKATVKRFNQKSVSVECEHGTRWTVSPQLLKKIPTGVLSAPSKILGS